MSTKPPVTATHTPLLKNAATAPLIYFDNIPTFGICNGSITVELATQAVIPDGKGGVITDMMCTAHLRCSPLAAKILISSLTNALEMMDSQIEAERGNKRESSMDDYRPN